MSLNSQAPAKVGTGRGINLESTSGTSGFMDDEDGPFSVCRAQFKVKVWKVWSSYEKLSSLFFLLSMAEH